MNRALTAASVRLAFVVVIATFLTLPAAAQVTIFSAFNLPPAVDGAAVKHADIEYSPRKGLKLDVYSPEQQDGPAPVVMFIYGGGWAAGDKFEYEFVGRAFAANGYVAVIADYRKFPEVTYPYFLYDNAEAMRWVEQNVASFGGDPMRFFLAGHSAGAYNAVMLTLDRSLLTEVGVSIPVRAVAAISGPYNFYPFEYEEVRRTFGEALNPEGTQPVNLVTPEAPPMLLASGTSDPIVRVQNSQALAQKLKAQGIWVTEKYYDGFGHMEPVVALGAMWRWRMPVLSDVLEFFQTFGTFPSGTRRPIYIPEPPVEQQDPMTALIREMDAILEPISVGQGG
jgi:acetyl esterase/lipase